MAYRATRESLRTHPVPAWFEDAKLGIFVHWGVQSVPAWAPPTGELPKVLAERGWHGWFANNPYADWYLNTIHIAGSPSQLHHQRTYGAGHGYDDFVPLFQEAAAKWDPDAWAALFQQVGARYVVLTTKHHDGFLLWPSARPNPHKAGYAAERDLVGELTSAVRAHGMRMGLYYSGGIDWTFQGNVIQGVSDLIAAIPQGAEYAAYVDRHWRELIDRYRPSVVWNDIGYPATADLYGLLAYYYNAVPDGVVNDRFTQINLGREGSLRYRLTLWIARMLFSFLMKRAGQAGSPPSAGHADFRTPEYASYPEIVPHKWEATRGLGYSFGYNQNETDAHMIPAPELVRLLIDIVSKNGNLLLNVGPMADGTIPDIQRKRLVALGAWLDANGEAILGTRPWVRAEGRTTAGTGLRFTRKDDALYAILLDTPATKQIAIRSLRAAADARVHLLGTERPLPWTQQGEDLALSLPEDLPPSPAYALRIEPAPR